MVVSAAAPRPSAGGAPIPETPILEADMLHEPAPDSGPDPATVYKTRLGLWMFLFYCVFYAGFVMINVLTGGTAMQAIVMAGMNLAVVYGMGLIVLALVMALIYNHLCTAKERELATRAQQERP
jgi:uncharacterized membrane protein (DUF485 family)